MTAMLSLRLAKPPEFRFYALKSIVCYIVRHFASASDAATPSDSKYTSSRFNSGGWSKYTELRSAFDYEINAHRFHFSLLLPCIKCTIFLVITNIYLEDLI